MKYRAKRRLKRIAGTASCMLVVVTATVVALCASGAMPQRTEGDPGTTLTVYEDMTLEEIQAELDRQVAESAMTVSIDPAPTIDADGTLSVHFVNVDDNPFPQRFTVLQDGEAVYESGAVMPGEQIVECQAPEAQEGKASVVVQALDEETLEDRGSPATVAVEIKTAR